MIFFLREPSNATIQNTWTQISEQLCVLPSISSQMYQYKYTAQKHMHTILIKFTKVYVPLYENNNLNTLACTSRATGYLSSTQAYMMQVISKKKQVTALNSVTSMNNLNVYHGWSKHLQAAAAAVAPSCLTTQRACVLYSDMDTFIERHMHDDERVTVCTMIDVETAAQVISW